MELHKGDAERYAGEVVELLHCERFDIEKNRGILKSVISCSEQVRESFSRMLENHEFLIEEVMLKESQNGGESVLYQKRVVEVLIREIEICPGRRTCGFKRRRKKACVLQWIQVTSAGWKVNFVRG